MADLPSEEKISSLVDFLNINSDSSVGETEIPPAKEAQNPLRSHQPTLLTDITEEYNDDASCCGSWEHVSRAGDEPDASKESDTASIFSVESIDYATFFRAADTGDVDTLRAILDTGADIEQETIRGWTALTMAVVERHIEAVKLLLSKGASVSHRVKSLPPLVHALIKGGIEITDLLVEHGACLKSVSSKDQKNALHWAASEGLPEAVEYFLDKGLDIEGKSKRGCTPLIFAADCGFSKVAELLLERGANLDSRSENGGNALIWSACHNHVDTAKVFLDKGVDINAVDNFGHSALFLAAHFGHLEMVNFLLEQGADANILSNDPKGMTVMQAATCEAHPMVVQRLIDHGCDPEIKTARGDTALDMALMDRREEVIPVLLEALGGKDYPKASVALQFATADSHSMVKALVAVTSLCYSRIKGCDITGEYEWISWAIEEGGSLIKMPALRKLLHYALEEKNLEMLKEVIGQGCDINTQLESTSTPLCFAVKHRNLPMMQLLLDAGADIDAFHGEGYNAVDEAIYNMNDAKDTEVVDLLLKYGACINRGKDPGHTAFSVVLLRGPEWNDLAVRMLDSVRDVDGDRDSMGSTLLHVATLRNHEDFIDRLLSKGADIESKDKYDITPFLLACQHSHKMLPVLLERGANINAVYRAEARALHAAAAQGNTKALEFLIEHGLNIEELTEKSYTPLACALTWGQDEAALLLMEKGANVNLQTKKGATPLHFACKNNLVRSTFALLERGSKVNVRDNDGWTPLHEACATGCPSIVRKLVECGADIELELPNKDRPLHVALINEEERIARALVESGASINSKASDGRSSLHLASVYNLPRLAELLIEMGASTEEIDENSWTPLCCFGGPAVAKVLIDHGANVNYADRDLWTPLHQAVESNQLEEARMLLIAGADMSIRTTDDGLTVRERAEDKQNKDVRENFLKLLDEFEVSRWRESEDEKLYPD